MQRRPRVVRYASGLRPGTPVRRGKRVGVGERMAAGWVLEARRAPSQEAGGGLEHERVEGADLGNKISTGSNEGKGKLQQHLRSCRRPRDRPIELLPKGRPVAEFLRPPGRHDHIRQIQRGGHVLEEGAFAVVGLQQGELHLRHRHRQWDGRQPPAAADVDHPGDAGPRRLDEDAGIGDQRLGLLGCPGAREVDASVPLEQELRVLLNFRGHNLTILTCRSTSSPA